MEGFVTEVIEKSSNEDYPLIVTFQNGRLLKQKKKGFKRKVEVTGDKKTGLKKVKISAGEGNEYVGTEEPAGVSRTFLVVRKAGTGKIKMTEVGKVSLMHTVLATAREVASSGKDYAAKNVALQKTFGGKKGIRRMEKSEKFRVNASTNESSLATAVNEMEVRAETESVSKQLDASLASVLPPCHRDAQSAAHVYILDELVGQDVLDAMEDVAIKSLLSQKNRLNTYTQALLDEAGSVGSDATATALLLVDSLVSFIRMRAEDMRKRDFMLSEHESIHRRIVDLFCHKVGNNLSRSLLMRDKAVGYCMALGFLVGGMVIPLDTLSQDTSCSFRKLSNLCRAVGGVAKERGSHKFVLKLPLPPLPSISNARKTSK